MLPLLIDEGPPERMAAALSELALDVRALGDVGAPPKNSTDDVNVAWCAEHAAVLVTNDRGKKQRVIRRLLVEHRVHAIFVYNDLRASPPHALARALLGCEERMEQIAGGGRKLVSHRLRPKGGLESLR